MRPALTLQTAFIPGGRPRVRRAFVVPALVVASAVALSGATTAAGPVTVRKDGEVYRVSATFETPHAAAVARAVLTDYEGIPRFMPDVRTSRVVSRDAAQVVVEQEAVARVLFFSKTVHLRLVVEEGGQTIAFRDTCGRSFARYEGTWTLREADGRAVVGYELTARPAFDVPDFILTRLLRRDADRLIANLQAEIAARVGRAAR
jgi:ribosome-associated toxin RatA of RatAB toxin-antitoxin module